MRWSGEEIHVTQGSGMHPQAPTGFVWRGRSYVVHEILDSWRVRTSWWRDLLSHPGGLPAGRGPGPAGLATTDLEEQVWRVSASPGRTGAPVVGRVGVYELGHARTWRLLRISD